MTLTLQLPPDLEQRLVAAAQAHGIAPSDCAVRLLDAALTESRRRFENARTMLREWRSETVAEQDREEYEELLRSLDEDRPSDRKLFPPELAGVSW